LHGAPAVVDSAGDGSSAGDGGWAARLASAAVPRLRTSLVGLAAPAFSGTAPDLSAASFDPGEGRAVLLFLTSSCEPCRAIWKDLAGQRRPGVVVVTPDAATEDPRKVAALAGRSSVIMSTEAWLTYGVSRAPWTVAIDNGVVVADCPASPSAGGRPESP
jgi:hypothetical protein